MTVTDLENYYLKQPEPTQSCLLALKGIIMKTDAAITHHRKFQIPFFYYKEWKLCFLWVKQKKLYLGFVEDRRIFPPSPDRKTNNITMMLIKPAEDLPIDSIMENLHHLIALYDGNLQKAK
jgi:hypothetical protein